jgi:hypothetical protein
MEFTRWRREKHRSPESAVSERMCATIVCACAWLGNGNRPGRRTELGDDVGWTRPQVPTPGTLPGNRFNDRRCPDHRVVGGFGSGLTAR